MGRHGSVMSILMTPTPYCDYLRHSSALESAAAPLDRSRRLLRSEPHMREVLGRQLQTSRLAATSCSGLRTHNNEEGPEIKRESIRASRRIVHGCHLSLSTACEHCPITRELMRTLPDAKTNTGRSTGLRVLNDGDGDSPHAGLSSSVRKPFVACKLILRWDCARGCRLRERASWYTWEREARKYEAMVEALPVGCLVIADDDRQPQSNEP